MLIATGDIGIEGGGLGYWPPHRGKPGVGVKSLALKPSSQLLYVRWYRGSPSAWLGSLLDHDSSHMVSALDPRCAIDRLLYIDSVVC